MIRVLLLIIGVLLLQNTNDQITMREYNNKWCYDGDTCYITYKGKEERLRIRDLNAPEMNTFKGIMSSVYANKLIDQAKIITFENIGRDKYGRVLADIYLDGESFKEIMIREGYGEEWIWIN